jgi:hypothetical protein
MTVVREAIKEIEDKVERRTRLIAQRYAEGDPWMREHINMWLDEVNDQIDKAEDEICDEFGRLEARLAELESSATLVDIGRRTNLSAM